HLLREGKAKRRTCSAAYRSAAVGWSREVFDRDPSVRLRRLRRRRPALIPDARRGTRVRGRLDARANHRTGAHPGAAGAAVLVRGLHRTAAAGGGSAGDVATRAAATRFGG